MASPKTIRAIPWKGKKQSDVMRGKPLRPSASASNRYYSKLRAMVLRMSVETKRELLDLFREPHSQEYFAQDASISSQARILVNELKNKFDLLFLLKAKPYAEDVAGEANRTSAASLKLSLKDLAQGVTLKTDFLTGDLNEVFTATVNENVALIKSISSEYFTDIQGAVMRSITTGNGLADLVPFIKKHEGITLRRARLIAHDQTRKAFANINRVRLEKLGVSKFEWLHSAGGQTPRRLHQELSGHVFSWGNLPVADERTGQRCGPGVLINCRCVAVPVIDFDNDFA